MHSLMLEPGRPQRLAYRGLTHILKTCSVPHNPPTDADPANQLRQMPLIRLEDGSHVVAYDGNQPRAFLPVGDRTGFPTVRRDVCRSEDALAFLKSLGLSPPDPVDDVIANVLPKYDQDHQDIPDPDYRSDIERILAAFATDSTAQRQKLASALRRVRFLRAMDPADGSHHFVCPADAYQATQRLKGLFASAPGVLIVDDSKDYLRGEHVRALLEAAGSPLYLIPIHTDSTLTRDEKAELRQATGSGEITVEIAVNDSTLRGLEPLLATIASLAQDETVSRSTLLWEALCDVEDRRGVGAFQGEYRWKWYRERRAVFDASFVRFLNEVSWVPDENGVLQRPRDVIFESTGWEANPFLLTKIRFKPPVIDKLAREAGIEPGVLTLLAQYGLTSVEELTAQLLRAGLIDGKSRTQDTPSVEDALRGLLGDSPTPTSPVPEPLGPKNAPGPGNGVGTGAQSRGRTNRPSGRRFISYIAVNSQDEEESDPDGLTRQQRMDLEDKAIGLILGQEPGLDRTSTHNPGFDLTEPGPDGQPVKWVEVKAMNGTLRDRPVGLSRTQFEFAQKHGKAFWLYIVEAAGSAEQVHLVRIQDPVGKSQTFTFDHGWHSVAEVTNAAELSQSQLDHEG